MEVEEQAGRQESNRGGGAGRVYNVERNRSMARAPRPSRSIRTECGGTASNIPGGEEEGRGIALFCAQFANECGKQRYVSSDLIRVSEDWNNVCKGDTYPAEVAATVYAVMQRLGFSNPYRLCWQSQVGPSAWLGAQTSDTVQHYVEQGQTDLILIPIAFTSDHIETLFELDQEVIHEAGHPGVKRAESLNGSPVFIQALADIAHAHLRSGESCSKQMGLRCQGCKSERCLEQVILQFPFLICIC